METQTQLQQNNTGNEKMRKLGYLIQSWIIELQEASTFMISSCTTKLYQ